MLNYNCVPVQAAPRRLALRPIFPARVRCARLPDWPRLRMLLLDSGLSLTGLAERFDTLLILEQTGRKGEAGEIVGAVAVEPGRLALIRSLAFLPNTVTLRDEAVLLECAWKLADMLGAEEAVLIVETTAQLPAHHQGVVLWDTLRKRRPDSALVRELSGIDSTALAVRLAPPRLAGSCAVR